MTGTPGYTVEEIRGYVQAYDLVPHGKKGAWLAQQPFSRHQMQRWRMMVFEGDLQRGLAPREYGGGTLSRGERSVFARARARELADYEAEVERLNARIRELEGANEALGKAIGLLHDRREQGPDTAPMSEPGDSSPPRTPSSGS